MVDVGSSREAEMSVLGTLLLEPTGYSRVLAIIKVGDFFFPDTKRVFQSMGSLFDRGIEINVQTVLNQFKVEGYTGLTEADLREFLDYRVNVETAISFAIQIAEFSGWRLLKRGVEDISKDIEKSSIDLPAAAHFLKGLSSKIVSKGLKDDVIQGSALLEEYIDMLNRPKNRYAFSGIKSVDQEIYDFNPKELSFIAARPGTGKTAFMLQSALFNLGKGHRVGFLSMEMERPKIINRMVSFYARVPGSQIINMSMEDFKKNPKLYSALEKITSMPLFVDDTGPWNNESVPSKIRKLVYEYDCTLIYVDYIGLILGVGELARAPRNQQLSVISAELKGLSSELNLPILAASQLNREVEKRSVPRPVLADLRDSGSLEQDASIVAFLYPDTSKEIDQDTLNLFREKDEAPVVFEIAKQRNGPKGTHELIFEKKFGRFVSKEERNATY